jgi:hypothetical protein
MRTENLQGAALDWAVAKCEGVSVENVNDGITKCLLMSMGGRFSPSTNWAQGGPIIEREELTLSCHWQRPYAIKVLADEKRVVQGNGPTPLIAAMRCLVASRLGDTIDLPEELK